MFWKDPFDLVSISEWAKWDLKSQNILTKNTNKETEVERE